MSDEARENAEHVRRFIETATTPFQRAIRDEIERLRSELAGLKALIAEMHEQRAAEAIARVNAERERDEARRRVVAYLDAYGAKHSGPILKHLRIVAGAIERGEHEKP